MSVECLLHKIHSMKTRGTSIWSKNCPAVASVKMLISWPSTSTFIRADFDRINGRRSFRWIVLVGARVRQGKLLGVTLHFVVFIRNAFPWFVGCTPMLRVVRTLEMALCTRVMLEMTPPRWTALTSRAIERQLGSTAMTLARRAAGRE